MPSYRKAGISTPASLEITWTTITATQHSSIGQRKLLFDAVLHPITPSTRLRPHQIFLHQHLLTANVDSTHFNWYHIRQASKGPTIVADIDLIKSFNCNELFSSYLELNKIDGHGHSWRVYKVNVIWIRVCIGYSLYCSLDDGQAVTIQGYLWW